MRIKEAILELSKPIPIEDIDWRVATIKEKNGEAGMTVLGYKDARVDMQRLDDVLKGCWSPSYQRDSKGVLQCTISIYVEMPDGKWQWVSKTSNGVESYAEKAKGEYSDAFKRAGFMLGIGRELYDLPFIYIKLNNNEFSVYKGKPRPKIGFNPNDFIWEKDDNGLLLCKDKNGKQRFKERKSQNKASKTNVSTEDSKVQKPKSSPKKTDGKTKVADLKALKIHLASDKKDKVVEQLSKQRYIDQSQYDDLLESKLVTKDELSKIELR